MHHRQRPIDHRFAYRVFSLWLDIDRLEEVASRHRLLAIDRWWPIAFFRADHGPRTGAALRPWIEAQLKEWDCPDKPARIMLLSMPRLLGYVFNPLSIYYCYDTDNRLEAVVYEVKNTFGLQHAYALKPPHNYSGGVFSHDCTKTFYVSPFIDMAARYHFRLRAPAEKLSFAIRESDGKGNFFVATHTAKRQQLNDWALAKCLLGNAAMTFKVFLGIHYEAWWLWLKGAPYFSREVERGGG